MIEFTLDEVVDDAADLDRERAEAYESIIADLRADPELMARVEESYGEKIDLDTDAGLDAFRDLLGRLGHRRNAAHENAVQEQMQRLRASADAKARLAAETAADAEPLAMTSLGSLLEADIPGEEFLIEGLLPAGGNVMFTAARKSGKSTTVGNLIRSLVDGDDFLDAFPVNETRKVMLVDLELSEATLQRWLREQGIKNVDAVSVLPLRGKARQFDILDDASRERIAELIKGHDVLIVDPLRPLADALGLNEHTEMGRLLEAFDALKVQAGVSEGIIVHHHGHGSDRARGDSRLEDWPDVIWRLQRDNLDDPRAFRMFSAFGRDVDIDAGVLQLTERHLCYIGDVVTHKTEQYTEGIVAALRASDGLNSEQVMEAVHGLNKNNRAGILKAAVESGRVAVRKEGPANIYHLPTPGAPF